MIPVEIILHNFRQYGENVRVNLEKYGEEAVLVIGDNLDSSGADSNMSGKTTLFEAKSYAIFGRIPDSRIALDDLIHWETDQMFVDFTMKEDDNILRIKRQRGKKNTLDFWVNGEKQTRLTPTQTQKALMNFLGIQEDNKEFYNDFLNTTYLSVEAVEAFAGKASTSEDRMKAISRFLSLDTLDKASNRANSLKKGVKSDLDNASGKVEYLQNKIRTEDEGRTKPLDEELSEARIELNNSNIEYQTLNSEFNKVKEKVEIEKQFNLNNTMLKQIESDQIEFNDTMDEMIKSKNEDKETNKTIDSQIVKLKDDVEHNASVAELEEDISKNKELGNIKYQEAMSLDLEWQKEEDKVTKNKTILEKGMKCPDCQSDLMFRNETLTKIDRAVLGEDISNSNKKITKLKASSKTLLKEYSDFLDENNIHECNIQEVKADLQKILVLQQSKKDEDKIDNEIRDLETRKEIKITKTKASLKEVKSTQFQITLRLKTLEHIDTSEIGNIEFKLSELNIKKERDKQTVNRLGIIIKQRDKDIEQLDKHRIFKDGLQKRYDDYQFLEKGFLTVRRWMIDSFLPAFEQQVNIYLDIFQVGLQITLDTMTKKRNPKKDEDDYKAKFELAVINENGIKTPFETYSEGGKKRIAVCVAFGLRQLTLNKGYNVFNFILLDEIADKLDGTGTDLFFRLLHEINGLKLVISHDNALKNRFKSTLTVTRENGQTFIKEKECQN